MVSFLVATAARRLGGSSGFFKGGLLAAGVATSCDWLNDAPISNCEAKKPNNKVNLKTRMTLIGRFSLESETITNPSIPTFFIGLSGPFSAQKFAQLWHDRGMEERHPRFHSRVDGEKYFTPMQEELQISDTLSPMLYRKDLKHRIQSCLTLPLQVQDALWQVQVSSGKMGTSGAIPKRVSSHLADKEESVLLFRGHHALADGVSLTAAFSDLCDEAQNLRNAVHNELKRRKRKGGKTFWQRLQRLLKMLAWFCSGSLKAMFHHWYLLLFTPANPFDALKNDLLDDDDDASPGRTVSWCDAAPLEQVKQVAHSLGPHVTVNDVMVSCVTYAIAKQLEQHRRHLQAIDKLAGKPHSTMNVVIPVHLGGGVLLPGKSVGNHIGAFCAQVPCESSNSSQERLLQVHDSLYAMKQTPAPLLSYWTAKVATTLLPSVVTKHLFTKSNAHACVAITNNRGSPQKLHLDGQAIESMAGFLPLPPGIPVGVSITSYAGTVSLSVTAEPWAVPNADQFLSWMLEEYEHLKKTSEQVK